MYGTIKVKCGNQKSIIRMEMLENDQIDVQCKFNPPMDITKTPTMEENFVGNVTQMIMSLIYANGNIKEQTNENKTSI